MQFCIFHEHQRRIDATLTFFFEGISVIMKKIKVCDKQTLDLVRKQTLK